MSADLLGRAEAEALTEKIASRLDDMATAYFEVMPLIREAITRKAWVALGYNGVSEYVSARFGGALQRLGVDVRREVVRELTAAGMSTRAIAPVVGVSDRTVASDRTAGAKDIAPDPAPPMPVHDSVKTKRTRAIVVGLDGKVYRPKKKPRSAKPSEPVLPVYQRSRVRQYVRDIPRHVKELHALNMLAGDAADAARAGDDAWFAEALEDLAAAVDCLDRLRAVLTDTEARRRAQEER